MRKIVNFLKWFQDTALFKGFAVVIVILIILGLFMEAVTLYHCIDLGSISEGHALTWGEVPWRKVIKFSYISAIALTFVISIEI